MAKVYSSAEQDSKGYWWYTTEDGTRIPVKPVDYTDPDSGDQIKGYVQDTPNPDNVRADSGIGAGQSDWSAGRLQSGDTLTPQEVQNAFQTVTAGTIGSANMSLQDYLNDPRTPIKVENGAYVYRPEQATGDYIAPDRESFMSALMPALSAWVPFVAPYLSSLGALAAEGAGAATTAANAGSSLSSDLSNFTLAAPGQGIGGVGSGNIGLNASGIGLSPELVAAGGGNAAMGISNGLGLQLPSGGLINQTASALASGSPISTGSYTDTINLPSTPGLFSQPTTPTITPRAPAPAISFEAPTLSQPGQGIGGVGTAGTGLSIGADGSAGIIGSTANDLAAAAGVGALPAVSGVGSGTGAGLGLNLPATGLINTTAADLAAQAGVSLPAAATGSGIGSGTTVPATTAAGTTAGSTAGTTATSASTLSRLLKDQFGIDIGADTLGLLGTGLSSVLGLYGANQQANATKDLYNQYLGMGAPYRAELANLNANPSSFLQSDLVKNSLQQGSDAMAKSLSAKVGNPILNPTALQEMQNYTSRGLLDAYNQRWNQLSSAGQLGTSQAASLGTNAATAQAGTANAIGAGLGSVFGNQQDYAGQLLNLLKNRSSLGGYSLA